MTHRNLTNAQIIKETAKAINVIFNNTTVWIPKSIASVYNNGDNTNDVIIPMWFANKVNLGI